MKNWSNFFLRVGGVLSLYAISILIFRYMFGGYETYAVVLVSFVSVVFLVVEARAVKARRVRKVGLGKRKLTK